MQEPADKRAHEALELGHAAMRHGRLNDAISAYGRAAMLQPKDAGVVTTWASALAQAGRLSDAAKIMSRIVNFAPNDEGALRLYCEILEALGDWSRLELIARRLADLRPDEPAAWKALSIASWEQGRYGKAMECYRTALEKGARDAQALATYGWLALQALRFEDAAAALSEAEAMAPSDLHTLAGKAQLHTMLGEFDLAETYSRRCLSIDPNDVSAYKVLNQLNPGQFTADEAGALARLAHDTNLRADRRISASYALADWRHARGAYDEAFAAYKFANELELRRNVAESVIYEAARRTAEIDEIITLFSSRKSSTGGASTLCPIFVLGMPRSGTTLVESAFAAHPLVFACGERGSLRKIIGECVAAARAAGIGGVTDQNYRDWVDAYFSELPDLRGATHITDKNPWNFDAIGLIPQLFPNAKIVHVRRNPVETGLSIYCNEFSKFQPFANRLEDIGHYYSQYARLMSHWEQVMGDAFMTVQYEPFVANFEEASAALLTACGLDRPTSFEQTLKTDRPIATLSLVQVRKGVAARDGRADRYISHIAPLVEALRRGRVDLATGVRIV